MVHLRLEITPSGVSDGPWAYMANTGLEFRGNVAEKDIPYAPEIQEIMLTFAGNNTSAKVDYELYLDNAFKKKGTAKIYQGTVGSLDIRFFLKAPQA